MKTVDPTEHDHPIDVIVIGAGPAGSTTAALLAEKGRNVVVLEKEKFPRYHVGESMMPFCWYTLERLGLAEKMDEIGFQQKHSVQFVTTDGKISKPFYFFQHHDHPSSTTWQVERKVFDQMIADKARENGATILEERKVADVIRDDSGKVIGVNATGPDDREETYFAPVVVDATGRDALVASKSKWRTRDPKLNKISIWTYFEDAKRDPGLDAGATTVAYLPEKGWFWYIPMRDNRVSVGVVAERDYLYREGETRDPAEIVDREIQENKWLADHIAPGKQVGEYWVTGEYSYRSEFCADDGLILVGDAFAFLDPVFSSGVFLALKSGEMAADAIDEALSDGDFSAKAFEPFGKKLCNHIEHMRKIVYAFYDEDFSFGKLIKKNPDLRGRLTDLLIGNLDGVDFEELFAAIGEICNLPEELDYGFRAKSREPEPALA
ncbi:MAG: FAD-dependent oxidoreductase [Verrucomicrobiales bacterium]|nr:FAD-dependent oxidoreductase [Verrucomicrobiales bacterium]